MAVDISPVLNYDIHNEVIGNCHYIGLGPGEDDEDEEEDDEEDYVVTDDDDDNDEEEVSPQNPYILDQVEEEDEEDDDADNNNGGGRTNHEKIHAYVTALCRGMKKSTVVSLKHTIVDHRTTL